MKTSRSMDPLFAVWQYRLSLTKLEGPRISE
jgi:hypothetical protein